MLKFEIEDEQCNQILAFKCVVTVYLMPLSVNANNMSNGRSNVYNGILAWERSLQRPRVGILAALASLLAAWLDNVDWLCDWM